MDTPQEQSWQNMNVTIDRNKFAAVCELCNDSPDLIADFIDGGAEGWQNADKHQEWITSASADEIAAWIPSDLE